MNRVRVCGDDTEDGIYAIGEVELMGKGVAAGGLSIRIMSLKRGEQTSKAGVTRIGRMLDAGRFSGKSVL